MLWKRVAVFANSPTSLHSLVVGPMAISTDPVRPLSMESRRIGVANNAGGSLGAVLIVAVRATDRWNMKVFFPLVAILARLLGLHPAAVGLVAVDASLMALGHLYLMAAGAGDRWSTGFVGRIWVAIDTLLVPHHRFDLSRMALKAAGVGDKSVRLVALMAFDSFAMNPLRLRRTHPSMTVGATRSDPMARVARKTLGLATGMIYEEIAMTTAAISNVFLVGVVAVEAAVSITGNFWMARSTLLVRESGRLFGMGSVTIQTSVAIDSARLFPKVALGAAS